jgi:hypothetical protein
LSLFWGFEKETKLNFFFSLKHEAPADVEEVSQHQITFDPPTTRDKEMAVHHVLSLIAIVYLINLNPFHIYGSFSSA